MLAIATRFSPGRRVTFPVPTHDRGMIEYLADLMASGAFVPMLDRTYPLEQIVEAYEYVESGQKIGNVVITFTSPACPHVLRSSDRIWFRQPRPDPSRTARAHRRSGKRRVGQVGGASADVLRSQAEITASAASSAVIVLVSTLTSGRSGGS